MTTPRPVTFTITARRLWTSVVTAALLATTAVVYAQRPLTVSSLNVTGGASAVTGVFPANLIAFTDAGSCPSGWSEFTSARGRYIVGLVSGGTNLATVGTALSNTENRAVGQHSHGVTDPGHNHTQNAHGHSVSDPGHNHTQNAHSHGVTDPGHNHTQNAHSHGVTDPGHAHGGGAQGGSSKSQSGSDFDPIQDYDRVGASATTGVTVDSATATNNAATTGISIDNATATNNAATTGISIGNQTATNNAATTGISINNSGSVSGTNAPYIQLMACKKS